MGKHYCMLSQHNFRIVGWPRGSHSTDRPTTPLRFHPLCVGPGLPNELGFRLSFKRQKVESTSEPAKKYKNRLFVDILLSQLPIIKKFRKL